MRRAQDLSFTEFLAFGENGSGESVRGMIMILLLEHWTLCAYILLNFYKMYSFKFYKVKQSSSYYYTGKNDVC